MTNLQHMLYVLGFGRFKRYRRWVGGRWVDRWSSGRWRWAPDARATFNDYTHAIEQWPTDLPTARTRQPK